MLNVIGVGFGRTGTNSLQLALEKLGFGPCYHMLEVIRHADHLPRWRHALSADKVEWDRVFDGYKSSVDWPGCAFWRELVETFPEAKVVLTVRDPESWYASVKKTIFATGEDTEGPTLPPNGLSPEAMEFAGFMGNELLPRIMDDGQGGRLDQADEERAIETFLRHNEEVQRVVPADRLLVHRVTEGWGPLCEFLDVPVPAEAFPHVNDSGTFRRTFEGAFAERMGLSVPGARG
ncbi:sulfotransferase family protein [Streptomyces sp. NBC_01525]|uniref:sulfotransferase family protein n=1 Tax=Streptomyces sp. NBC_01525 TaxID=2903893 RepID=UPI00386A2065